MTYRQAEELNAHVRKGEQGSLVVYADRVAKTETNEKGEDVEREIAFMKGYTVFNVEQIDGLPAHYYAKPEPKGDPLKLIESAEAFFADTGATFRHGGNKAYYAPGPDYIQLPPPEAFTDAESYAAVKAHELIHWSSHPSRLARVLGKRFGDNAYAAEELDCRTWRRFPLRRSWHHAGAESGSRLVSGALAEGFEGRQARDLHRGRPGAARRRLPARAVRRGFSEGGVAGNRVRSHGGGRIGQITRRRRRPEGPGVSFRRKGKRRAPGLQPPAPPAPSSQKPQSRSSRDEGRRLGLCSQTKGLVNLLSNAR